MSRELPMASSDRPAPRVAVVGAGAVGSYFGAYAALAGANVTLCLREPRPELVIRSGQRELRPAVQFVTDPGDLRSVDLVLLAVKAHQTASVTAWLAAMDGPETPLVALQNGVGHAERLDGIWSGPILPAVVYCGVEMVSPGVVEHHSYGRFHLQSGPDAERVAAVFGPDQEQVVRVDDIAVEIWNKLVLNSVANSLTALTCRRLDVLHEAGMQAIARDLVQEGVAVARAEGVNLTVDVTERTLSVLLAQPPEGASSMLYDRLRGRELEHEALIGSVVALGTRNGVATPTSAVVLSLLRAVSGRPLAPKS